VVFLSDLQFVPVQQHGGHAQQQLATDWSGMQQHDGKGSHGNRKRPKIMRPMIFYGSRDHMVADGLYEYLVFIRLTPARDSNSKPAGMVDPNGS